MPNTSILQEKGKISMKKIGLIGGLSWQSTVEYYRVINEESNRRDRDQGQHLYEGSCDDVCVKDPAEFRSDVRCGGYYTA